jgi:hypothetical protein
MAPRDPWSIIAPDWLDAIRATAWAPPNLPLFAGAPPAAGSPAAARPPVSSPEQSFNGLAVGDNASNPLTASTSLATFAPGSPGDYPLAYKAPINRGASYSPRGRCRAWIPATHRDRRPPRRGDRKCHGSNSFQDNLDR